MKKLIFLSLNNKKVVYSIILSILMFFSINSFTLAASDFSNMENRLRTILKLSGLSEWKIQAAIKVVKDSQIAQEKLSAPVQTIFLPKDFKKYLNFPENSVKAIGHWLEIFKLGITEQDLETVYFNSDSYLAIKGFKLESPKMILSKSSLRKKLVNLTNTNTKLEKFIKNIRGFIKSPPIGLSNQIKTIFNNGTIAMKFSIFFNSMAQSYPEISKLMVYLSDIVKTQGKLIQLDVSFPEEYRLSGGNLGGSDFIIGANQIPIYAPIYQLNNELKLNFRTNIRYTTDILVQVSEITEQINEVKQEKLIFSQIVKMNPDSRGGSPRGNILITTNSSWAEGLYVVSAKTTQWPIISSRHYIQLKKLMMSSQTGY